MFTVIGMERIWGLLPRATRVPRVWLLPSSPPAVLRHRNPCPGDLPVPKARTKPSSVTQQMDHTPSVFTQRTGWSSHIRSGWGGAADNINSTGPSAPWWERKMSPEKNTDAILQETPFKSILAQAQRAHPSSTFSRVPLIMTKSGNTGANSQEGL